MSLVSSLLRKIDPQLKNLCCKDKKNFFKALKYHLNRFNITFLFNLAAPILNKTQGSLKRKNMEYYFSKMLDVSFDEAVQLVTESLKSEGFGIISEINIHEKLHEKLGINYKKYKILGACNPSYAYKALMIEEKIGTMLPCNVIVIDQGNGRTEVSAVNPVASMMAIQNNDLESIAFEITEKVKRVIETLL